MASPYALTKTKAELQASPYFYQWDTRSDLGGDVIVHKQMGSTRLYFHAANDTEAIARINAHEGWLVVSGKSVHR